MKTHALLRCIGIASVLMAGGGLLAAPSLAGKTTDRPRIEGKKEEQAIIRAAMKRRELMPLPKAIAIARKLVPGDVIKVDLELEKWGIKYEVKILAPSGRVREVELNARTGALIKIEDD